RHRGRLDHARRRKEVEAELEDEAGPVDGERVAGLGVELADDTDVLAGDDDGPRHARVQKALLRARGDDLEGHAQGAEEPLADALGVGEVDGPSGLEPAGALAAEDAGREERLVGELLAALEEHVADLEETNVGLAEGQIARERSEKVR